MNKTIILTLFTAIILIASVSALQICNLQGQTYTQEQYDSVNWTNQDYGATLYNGYLIGNYIFYNWSFCAPVRSVNGTYKVIKIYPSYKYDYIYKPTFKEEWTNCTKIYTIDTCKTYAKNKYVIPKINWYMAKLSQKLNNQKVNYNVTIW